MNGIHKLPFLLGGFMALISGVISYACGTNSRTTYIRMAVAMVVFYIVGSYIKNTLYTIQAELKEKKEQELLEAQNAEESQTNQNPLAASSQAAPAGEHRINLVASDSEDGFSPLTISRIIASKSKE